MHVDDRKTAGGVSLESVLCTEELDRRAPRAPDYKTEAHALGVLSQALVNSPHAILQVLTDTILDACKVDSAGVSLLTKDDGERHFFWPAISGTWKAHVGGGTPRDFGPCGDVLDRGEPLLFNHPERRYTYIQPVTPAIEECLLVPFYIGGKAVGTIWAITHTKGRKFDAEDLRILKSLATFASAAYQVWDAIDSLKSKDLALQESEHRLVDQIAERTLQLNAAHVRLRRGDRLAIVGTMAAGLVHDISNVTLPLSMRLELILADPKLNADTSEALGAISELVEHLRQMARNLSLFSRDPEQEGSAGRTDLNTWAKNVKTLIEGSVADSQRRKTHSIRMNWNMPEGLPMIGVAPHRLTQAVVNLVHNSWQAIIAARAADASVVPRAAERGVVNVEAKRSDDGKSIVLSVCDDGIGMDEETRLRCGELFFTTKNQVDAGARGKADASAKPGARTGIESAGGSGMGMSIALAIAERVGGRMDIETELGKGTTVHLTLPVVAR